MRPGPGELAHFSEDAGIEEFVPHVAATAQQAEAYVWAVDAGLAPAYWFPRQCPRAMAWVGPRTTAADRLRILGPGGGDRVHAIEHRWLDAFLSAELFAYRLAAEDFRPFPSATPHAWVSTVPVRPLGPPVRVTRLAGLHAQAGIQLRVLDDLTGFFEAVVDSTLEFSGIRMRNARGS